MFRAKIKILEYLSAHRRDPQKPRRQRKPAEQVLLFISFFAFFRRADRGKREANAERESRACSAGYTEATGRDPGGVNLFRETSKQQHAVSSKGILQKKITQMYENINIVK